MAGRLNVIATVVQNKMRVEDLEMLDIVGAVFCADFLILSNQAPDLHAILYADLAFLENRQEHSITTVDRRASWRGDV